MKHTLPVTILLVLVFLASQLLGLGLLVHGAAISKNADGTIQVDHMDPVTGERVEPLGNMAPLVIVCSIAVATIALLILIRFHLINLWKLWFFCAVTIAMSYTLATLMPVIIAVIVAIALALWKIWRPNVIVHNTTEVMIYSGIALAVVPLFSTVLYGAILLLIIAIYDMYAVWKSKHMVAMANFQTESKLFAGLYVPYTRAEDKDKVVTVATTARVSVASAKTTAKGKGKTVPASAATLGASTPAPTSSAGQSRGAILGGGDVAFPLLFSGIVADSLLRDGLTQMQAFTHSLWIVGGAGAALLLLFIYAKKDRFYPAMPFLTAGCFIGYGLLVLFS